jgi:hypothetical protein
MGVKSVPQLAVTCQDNRLIVKGKTKFRSIGTDIGIS